MLSPKLLRKKKKIQALQEIQVLQLQKQETISRTSRNYTQLQMFPSSILRHTVVNILKLQTRQSTTMLSLSRVTTPVLNFALRLSSLKRKLSGWSGDRTTMAIGTRTTPDACMD